MFSKAAKDEDDEMVYRFKTVSKGIIIFVSLRRVYIGLSLYITTWKTRLVYSPLPLPRCLP